MLVALEDLALCAYSLCEDDFSLVENYTECVPESLYILHSIADTIGIKIRFSTVLALREHVKPINNLRESDVEQILIQLQNVVTGEERAKALREILKILFGREIEINRNEQDLAEVTIAALYASLVNVVSVPHITTTPLEQVIEVEPSPAATIT